MEKEVIKSNSGLSKTQVMFLYIVCTTHNLGFIQIVKTIFMADRDFFKEYRKPITGYTYLKKKNGPVPAEIQKDVDVLKAKGYIKVETVHGISDPKWDFTGTKKLKIDTNSFFSSEEIQYINSSRDTISDMSTSETVELFHDHVYDIFNIDEEIPLFMYLDHRGPTEQEKTELMEKYAQWL